MGKKRKTTQEVVEASKEIEVEVEEVKEKEAIVLVCDVCGNEENEDGPQYHELAHNPKLVTKELRSVGGQGNELGGLGKSIKLSRKLIDSKYDRIVLTADDGLVLCDYCFQNLFSE